MCLLQDPSPDGGQWDMVVNLVKKYGLMPKTCFPESFSCQSSQHMNTILKSKVSLLGKKELRGTSLMLYWLLSYSSVSQPPGHGPVPGPGINYTGT